MRYENDLVEELFDHFNHKGLFETKKMKDQNEKVDLSRVPAREQLERLRKYSMLQNNFLLR